MQFGGTPLEAVVEAIAQDRFAVCDQIEEEIVRVLTRRLPRPVVARLLPGHSNHHGQRVRKGVMPGCMKSSALLQNVPRLGSVAGEDLVQILITQLAFDQLSQNVSEVGSQV
jgi:hypothetical protein